MNLPARNKCPHPRCEKLKDRSYYACGGHWRSLPANIRNKIQTGYQADPTLWSEGHLAAQKYWLMLDDAYKKLVENVRKEKHDLANSSSKNQSS